MVFEIIPCDFVITYSFNDSWEIMKKVAKIMLFLDERVIIIHGNVSYFLIVESNSVLLVNIVENH